jgi:hypothetical protein
MMTASNIFGFAWMSAKFGGAEPIFGGARLPNDLEKTNRDCGSYDQLVEVGRIARRAVGTNLRQLFYRSLFAQLGIFSLQRWSTFGQRLGAFMGSDLMQGQHPSRTSGKPWQPFGSLAPPVSQLRAAPDDKDQNFRTIF